MIEKEWIENFAKEHPELSLIHCSSNALPIKGATHLSLSSTAKKVLLRSYDLSSLLWSAVAHCKLPKQEKLLIQLGKLYDSFESCSSALEKGSPNLLEVLEQEDAFNYVIQPLQKFFALTLARDLQRLKKGNASTKDFIALERRNRNFMKLVVEINLECIEGALQEYEDSGHDLSKEFRSF
jgi:hypothetical protein